VFAGDALSHVAFTGGLAALAFGFAARTGVFAATVAAAIVLAALGGRARLNDVVTGVVFTWLLGLGVLFLTIFTASRATTNGTGAIRVLFGSIFGVSGATATQTMLIAAGVVVAMVGIGRPLLFASIDPAVAEARGVPVTTLNVVFLAAVGIMVAQLVQVVGALLLLGLITTPAATAQRLTARPWRAVGASVAIAVATVWVGLWLGYVRPTLPPSTAIIGTGFLAWLAVELGDRTVRRHTRRPKPAEQPAP
jgi:zinc/manganese transport system permease protein